jgi:rare lipoprotein A
MKIKNWALILLMVLSPLLISAGELEPNEEDSLKIQQGTASYYGRKFHQKRTANGEVFDMQRMTAAHKNLPFGTMLKVTNLKNEKVVWVRVNDRLPQNSKRIIDISRAAATEIGMINDGVAKVKIEVPDQGTINFLLDHYQDNKPDDIRLRIYEEPLTFSKFDHWMMEFEVDLGEMVEFTI